MGSIIFLIIAYVDSRIEYVYLVTRNSLEAMLKHFASVLYAERPFLLIRKPFPGVKSQNVRLLNLGQEPHGRHVDIELTQRLFLLLVSKHQPDKKV